MSQVLSKEQLIQIADEFGTPLCVYHAERIAEQYPLVKELKDKLKLELDY